VSIRSRCAALILVVLGSGLRLRAQTLPATGAIYGTVVDEQGGPLPGAQARLVGAGERAPAVTDARGEFRFLYLSPGTYSVSLSLDGFAPSSVDPVLVEAARNTPVRVAMRLASVAEEVVVSGATPAIDPRKTVTGATFGEKELQAIPSARNVWATLWQVPGVVSNQVNVGGNTAVQASPVSKGVSGPTYNLEGSDITIGGLSPTFYNFDSFQEVQIVTGGSDITLLNGGATFNMAVKRGTNSIHGSARYFYAPDRWQADNTPAEVNVEELTPSRTNVLRDYGVEAGGPLIADRLWLWGAWGKNNIDLQKLGLLDTEGRQVNENSTLENFDARLDAQIAASNSLELYYHHGNRTQLNRGLDPNTAPEAAFDLSQPVPIYKIEDTHVFSPSLTASAFFSYTDYTQTSSPVSGLGPQMYRDADAIQRGNTFFYQALGVVRQGGASASKFFTTGGLSHELKFGFGYRYAANSSETVFPGNQVVADAFYGSAVITRKGVNRNRQQKLDGYVSDTLTADRLTVNAGVRYDYGRAQTLSADVPANPAYPDLLPAVHYAGDAGYPISAGSWEPRVGATYAAGRKRHTLLRASYARFADLFLDGIRFATPFPGAQSISYYWVDQNGDHLVQPNEVDFGEITGFYNVDPSDPTSTAAPSRISPGLKPSTVDEAVVGVDQELFAGLTASLNYTYRTIRSIVFSPPIGVTSGGGGYAYFGNASGSVTDPNGFGLSFDVPYYGVTLDPPPTGVELRNRPGYRQTYQGIGLQLVKSLSDNWLLRGTFAWNYWKQSVSPEAIFNPNETPGGPNLDGGVVTSANFGTGSAWTFSLSGLYRLPLGFALSGALSGRQGFPQQYFVVVNPHDTTANRVSILTDPVGTYRLPDVYELDLRVQNTFAVGPVSVTPSLSVYNAANANTVLARRGQVGTYDAARAGLPCADPAFTRPFCPDPRFNQIQDFESPRIFQVAIQVAF